MNIIDSTQGFVLVGSGDETGSVKPPQLSISRRISIAFVYNAIHVGYGRPMCQEVTAETPQTRTNKIPGTKQKCKTNAFHVAQCRALPKVSGLYSEIA